MKGAWGEKAAREWLEKQGWRTVQANFRTRFGEIDLIAENERFLVFMGAATFLYFLERSKPTMFTIASR